MEYPQIPHHQGHPRRFDLYTEHFACGFAAELLAYYPYYNHMQANTCVNFQTPSPWMRCRSFCTTFYGLIINFEWVPISGIILKNVRSATLPAESSGVGWSVTKVSKEQPTTILTSTCICINSPSPKKVEIQMDWPRNEPDFHEEDLNNVFVYSPQSNKAICRSMDDEVCLKHPYEDS